MGIRADNRLRDSPLVPVDCGNCGARVLVRKSSWEQTSIQWNADAMASCPELREADALEHHGRCLVLVCAALRESIEDAARDGSVPILDEIVD